MSFFSRVSFLWKNLLHKGDADQQLDDEIRSYVDLLKEEKIRGGMAPEQAQRAALLEVGGVQQVKERVRDVRIGVLLETLFQDLRYGLRSMRRNLGFTTTAVIALALGIGANAAIFSVVNAVLLRPLPYKDSSRLVVILHDGDNPVAAANFVDWRDQSQSFAAMGAADYWTPDLTGVDRPEKLWALKLTSNMFPILGVQPLLGRVFLPEEDQPGKEHEVVLSFRLWQRRFAGDPHVLGQKIRLNGEDYAIIGIMPKDFRFAPFWAVKAELWVPDALGERIHDRGGNSLRVFARLKPDRTLEQSRAEMATITARLEKQYPGTNRAVTVLSLKEKVVGDVQTPLLVLLAAVGFVLLIACANVAHMLLARAATRQKEIAVRAALGARRGRMVRQFLTESLLLALLGGALGLLLAQIGIRALVALAGADMPRVESITLDTAVVVFSLALSIITAVLFGTVPALHASVLNVSESLNDGGRGTAASGTIRRNRFRNSLVVSEFALALVLLVGAGLLVRTFQALRGIDPGFNPHHLMTMVVSVSGSPEGVPGRRAAFYQQLVDRVRALPGVESASAINHLPLAGDVWGWQFWIDGRPLPPPGDSPGSIYRVILPGYFRTMQMTVRRGRDIDANDNLNATPVVVVNERLASKYFPGEDPIGHRITSEDPREHANPHWLTIVGVVRNVTEYSWATPPDSELYVPYLQDRQYLDTPGSHVSYLTLVVRTAGDPAALAPAIENAVHSLDKNAPLSEVQTMEQVVADSTGDARFSLFLLGTFAALALALAAVGIYGVMSYSVSRRTHEMGVRVALGARPGDVLRLIIGQGMALALIGVVVGAVAALGLTRLMQTLLYGVSAADWRTYFAVALLLGFAALVACYIPARRATRIDPLLALRHE